MSRIRDKKGGRWKISIIGKNPNKGEEDFYRWLKRWDESDKNIQKMGIIKMSKKGKFFIDDWDKKYEW